MSQLKLDRLQVGDLEPINLLIDHSQSILLHGESGSGKSRLLRALVDLDHNLGEVWLDGTARSAMKPANWRHQVMLVPSETHWWAEQVGDHCATWNHSLLKQLGFAPDCLAWPITRLSSGEKQRLGLLRALSGKPKALLLDEVTANLDSDNTHAVEHLILVYQKKYRVPILWISHDQEQRKRLAGFNNNRLVRLENKQLLEDCA